jgi:hypothetical protein
MREFFYAHFSHVLSLLIMVSRLGDIGSTYLVTPNLTLEANPIAKKLGWRFAFLSLFLCFIPYYNTSLAIIVLVPSLLISSSNIGKIWLIRSIGEQEYAGMLLRLAQKGKLSHAISGVLVSAFFMFLVGVMLWFLSPDPALHWGYWFGFGIMIYSVAIAFYGSLYFIRLFRLARKATNSFDEGAV